MSLVGLLLAKTGHRASNKLSEANKYRAIHNIRLKGFSCSCTASIEINL